MGTALQLLALPVPIDVDFTTLGTRTRVRIAGHEGEICLPRLVWEAGSDQRPSLDAPSVRGVRQVVEWNRTPDQRIDWGRAWQWNPQNRTGCAGVDHALLRIATSDVSENALLSIAKVVEGSLDVWYETVTDWLEVLTWQDLDHRHRLRNVHSRSCCGTAGWLAAIGKGRYRTAFFNPPISVVVGDRDASATPAQWRWAIRAANGARSVPSDHLLIRDARNAARRADVRRAVLDAATAVEISLAHFLDGRLAGANEPFVVQRLLRQNRELGARTRVAADAGFVLPDSVQPDLIDVRNRVIHANDVPSPAAARRAVEIARTVVYLQTPLPQCARTP